MSESFLEVRCPCCRNRLEVDTKTGKARKITGDEAAGLDDLVSRQRTEAQRLADLFDGARRDQDKSAERHDELFRQARKDADDDRSKPRNPFDLE